MEAEFGGEIGDGIFGGDGAIGAEFAVGFFVFEVGLEFIVDGIHLAAECVEAGKQVPAIREARKVHAIEDEVLPAGGHKSCTITNDDIAPTLTLTKVVNKTHGGTANPDDFKLTVGSSPVLSGVKNIYKANLALAWV